MKNDHILYDSIYRKSPGKNKEQMEQKKTASNVTDFNTTISIITLNVNNVKISLKRLRLSDQIICCLKNLTLKIKI